jgi:PAS domain S-box-containing protein
MGELTRQFDWSRTPLGPPESWPQSLKTTVFTLLNSRYPMFLWWGPENTQLYNDGYIPSIGAERHPSALGQRGEDCWAEIWPVIGPLVEHVRTTREATWAEDQLIPITRGGFLQECFWTFSYSPILDESGAVAGVLSVAAETTERVQREREMGTLRDLAAQAAQAKDEQTTWRTCIEVLATNPADVPFAFAYVLDRDPTIARLASSTDGNRSPLAPDEIALGGNPETGWPLRRVAETGHGELVRDVRQRFGDFVGPPWPEPIHSAFVSPIMRPGAAHPYGFLIAGASPRRVIDDNYRSFLSLVADHIASAIANARAYEDERKRADALAEIDRAKTNFFSNVSHEFRTPLTLMLGPLEDSLAEVEEPLAPRHRERLALVHKSALRLLKLVNSLLDFSRIEAGRMQASYEATDVPTLTRELVSQFASTAGVAGIALIVDSDPLPEPIWVDREMWEKIVLNLVSNAFRHTFEGSIAVHVRWLGDHAELSVSDTGTGIPESELPKLFERFHRVKGARARTIEGSGIGLALVQELVKLHGGTIRVESQLGQGSTFTVSIPTGNRHLPKDRLTIAGRTASTATRAQAFVHEASSWIDRSTTQPPPARGPSDSPKAMAARAHILLAEDNADMRDYVRRLLEEHYSVEAVADGYAALEAARARAPDLVLSDVMMPNLDGFGLIAALHADPRTVAVPVILLSARAGEEATLEGLQAGASDYLVKPFSARELAARVEGTLRTAKARLEAQRYARERDELLTLEQDARRAAEAAFAQRRAWEDRLLLAIEQAPIGMALVDVDGRFLQVNRALCEIVDYSAEELLQKRFQDITHPDDIARDQEQADRLARGEMSNYRLEKRYLRRGGGTVTVNLSVALLRGLEGEPPMFIKQIEDITERKRSEAALRLLAQAGVTLTASLDLDDIMTRVTELIVGEVADWCVMEIVVDHEASVRIASASPEHTSLARELEQMSTYSIIRGPVIEQAWSTGRPVLIGRITPDELPSYARSEEHLRVLREVAPCSLLVVPLTSRDQRLGMMLWISSDPDQLYDQNHLRLASTLAGRISLAIENTRLYQAAVQANQLRDQVLGVVAHDLRNPLNVIQLAADALQFEAEEAEHGNQQPLQVILRATERMNHLIQDLLDVFQIEAGQLRIERTRMSGTRFLSETVESLRAIARKASLELTLEVEGDIPEICGDHDRLCQVIENLIGNAVKFTPEGGKIEVGARPQGPAVLYYVADTGRGIPSDSLPHVFDRFWQAKTGGHGAGLGLPIVRGLVDALGGRIWVESTPGVGSTFFFTIPVVAAGDKQELLHSSGLRR